MKKPGPQCDCVKENLSAMFDGELPVAEADALLKRIQTCAEEGCTECTELLEDLKKMGCICEDYAEACCPPEGMLEDLKGRISGVIKHIEEEDTLH